MRPNSFQIGHVIDGCRQDAGYLDPPLPARLGPPWNGYANPYFARPAADRVVKRQRALLASLSEEQRWGLIALEWDGDAIVAGGTHRPGSALDGFDVRPGRIEPVPIDGVPHWHLGFGWRWEQVAGPLTDRQRRAGRVLPGTLDTVRETLRVEPRLRRREPDGTDTFPVFAHLGEHADTGHQPLPIYWEIGKVTIAPDGKTRLTVSLAIGGEQHNS